MSRYTIPPNDRRFQVIVGWDAPLTTFFAQVFDMTVDAEEDDTACVLWVGADLQALTTVAAVQDALQAYATIAPDVAARLQHDQATTQPRSALQERMLQWLHGTGPRHGSSAVLAPEARALMTRSRDRVHPAWGPASHHP